MQIWIDGDACPRVIKDVVFRAAIRTRTHLILVANHAVTIPPSPFIKRRQVGSGFDVVDVYIVEQIEPGDLVVTADIPFADAVISARGFALNPRGEMYTTNNIKQYLAVRNLNESLRSCRMINSGPDKFSQKEIQCFANSLDTFLAKQPKARPDTEAP